MRGRTRALTAALVVVSLLAAAAPATAQGDAPEEALVVSLSEGGSAEVLLGLTYDLTDDDRRAAFDSLRADAAARERRARSFGDRLRGVAAAIAAERGRSTAVENVSADLWTVDRTGVVELGARVDGFAATPGDRVRVTSPFAGGVVTDRPLVLRGPDGFARTAAAPEADAATDDRLRWDTNRDLSGFAVTFAAQEEGASDSGASAPGFGAVGAVAALVTAGVVAGRAGRR